MNDKDILKIIEIAVFNDVDTAMEKLHQFFDEKDILFMKMLMPKRKP